jgi:NADH-quinone oxidoreductase subunit N
MSALMLDLGVIAPELIVAVGAMALLLIGVFGGDRRLGLVSTLAVVVLLAAAFASLNVAGPPVTAFQQMLISDAFATFLKVVILIGASAAILMAVPFLESEKLARFEYPVIIVLASLGMMLMVSANDLITLYIGLELQSLALYILAAFNRDDKRSTEAGLKYFVLGALSSGLLLYGCSLVYGFTGTTNFEGLREALAAGLAEKGAAGVGLLFGLVFILAGLAFKVSAVPFHMWTPDVYEGSPTPVTAFFAAAPKVAAMGLLLRVVFDAFPALTEQWRQIIVFISIGSMLLGAIAAIAQTNIKRLLAYSSIGHVGYALIGVAAGGEMGVRAVLVYMAIYLAMTIGVFLCVLAMRRERGQVENISDLAGLAQTQPTLAFCLAVLMFSLAGIPLLAGFFGKLFIFQAAMAVDTPLMTTVAVLGVLASVISAYYYLRVIKIAYFDKPEDRFAPFGGVSQTALLAAATAASSPLSFFYIAPLVSAAGHAAQSLLVG